MPLPAARDEKDRRCRAAEHKCDPERDHRRLPAEPKAEPRGKLHIPAAETAARGDIQAIK